MLYQAYEFQRQFANPVRLWANALELRKQGREEYPRKRKARQ